MFGKTNERIKAFRYGSDEFIMIVENPDATETQTIIETVRKELSRENLGFDISATVGCATGKGNEINKLVKMADALMYNNKIQNKGDSNA